MASGKKAKKPKGKTLALTDFLQETPGPAPTIPLRKSTLNWADDVEDDYDSYENRSKSNVVLPTAPKASRGLDDFSEKIPQQPPYIAYLSNLPYDVNEDDIADFFGNLRISNMRIPKEDRPGEATRLKGFGYVEFEDRESLIEALAIPDCTLRHRRIRIEIATNSDNERRRGGRQDNMRDRADRPEVSTGDWRSGPRAEPSNSDRRGGGGGGGGGGGFNRDNRDKDREAPPERDRGGSWRDGGDRPTFRDSDRNDRPSFRDSNRSDRPSFRDSDRSDRPSFRDSDRGFGDRNKYGDDDRRGFPARRNDRDRDGRPRDDAPSERSDARTRPKLVLAPRSRPVEGGTEAVVSEPQVEIQRPSAVPASSIFGAAKPVDTSARERQIEERLAKELEKPTDANRDSRRETREDDRKDWGRRREDTRRSPRRGSPERRSSPKYSPKRYSPKRSPGRDSPNHRDADDRSPVRRRSSPDYRSKSPMRRRSPSPMRRRSPDRRFDSPGRKESSFDSRKEGEKKNLPERRRSSPDQKRGSDKKRFSPPRGPPRKTDDKDKKPSKADRPPQKDRNDKGDKAKKDDKLTRDDRELPKLKEPEPPNFIGSNKYAFLEAEGDEVSD